MAKTAKTPVPMIFTNNLQWWETDEQWLETLSVRDDPPQGSRDFIYTEINSHFNNFYLDIQILIYWTYSFMPDSILLVN